MVDFLELPTVRRMVSRISVEEYHRLDEYNANGMRTELVRGIMIEKVGKTPLHCFLQGRLLNRVHAAAGDGLLVHQYDPITLIDSEPEPDISVVRGKAIDFRHAHPRTALFAVEVADTTLELDRAKATLYAEAGIPEYWLVNAQEQTVEVFTKPFGGLYAESSLYTRAETLVSAALPALRVELDTLFPG